MLEEYSKKYLSFNLQRLRLPVQLQSTHLQLADPSDFEVVLCQHIVAMENVLTDLNPRFTCLVLGEAFNQFSVPILDAVCQLQKTNRFFVGKPLTRIMVTDNILRASQEIQRLYKRKLTNGLSHSERQATLDAIESYKEFKRSRDFEKIFNGKGEERRRAGASGSSYVYGLLSNKLFPKIQESMYRRRYKPKHSLEWACEGDGEQSTMERPSGGKRGKTTPYVLLLCNKEGNYRTTFLTPFQSDLRSVIRNIAVSLPLTHLLVVREHPRTKARKFEYVREAWELGNVRFASRNCDFFELINDADVVLTIASSSIVDALLMGRPVISLVCPTFMVGEAGLPVVQMETWDELSKLIETWRRVHIPEQKVLAYFYSFLFNTTSSLDDKEGFPDWPDARRSALKGVPWYIPGQEALMKIGEQVSNYITEFDSKGDEGSQIN